MLLFVLFDKIGVDSLNLIVQVGDFNLDNRIRFLMLYLLMYIKFDLYTHKISEKSRIENVV